MKSYYVEVIVHGRIGVVVEAENEQEAEDKAYDHPDVPYLDKYYETHAQVVYEVPND